LIERVCDLGVVDLRDDVKGVLLRHLIGRITSKREHVKVATRVKKRANYFVS
jgi:hypothetical protein